MLRTHSHIAQRHVAVEFCKDSNKSNLRVGDEHVIGNIIDETADFIWN